ncbi:hypothetical protein GOV07_02920 [Candidatus Woesearchaeota archaeon]|nr:hypothetical protein [Candidatus Woesearchaeota archaeon]
MGFDLSTFLWDFIKQGILIFLAAGLLFASVFLVSGDDFFQRYYAKDVGLVLDASHAARGDVTLNYDKIMHSLDFATTEKSLELKRPNHADWEYRKRIPRDLSPQGATLTEDNLSQPAVLTLLREGRDLSLTTAAAIHASCSAPDARPAKVTTRIVIEGVSSLLTREVLDLATSPKEPVETITIKIEQSATLTPATIEAQAVDTTLGDSLICNLAVALTPYEVLTTTSTTADETVLTFTHPPSPGLDEDKLASALIIMLEATLS